MAHVQLDGIKAAFFRQFRRADKFTLHARHVILVHGALQDIAFHEAGGVEAGGGADRAAGNLHAGYKRAPMRDLRRNGRALVMHRLRQYTQVGDHLGAHPDLVG